MNRLILTFCPLVADCSGSGGGTNECRPGEVQHICAAHRRANYVALEYRARMAATDLTIMVSNTF
jgi:hypothetical protein